MAQAFASLEPDVARDLFDYDPSNGLLRWKLRYPLEKFRARNTRRAGQVAGHRHVCTVGKTYIQVRLEGRIHYAHRIVWVLAHGPIPADMQIDHIDGDGTNNRLENLRLVTVTENRRNMRRFVTNKSGRTGVFRDNRRGGWIARAWSGGKIKNLGHFHSFDEACAAREAFEESHGYHARHGEVRAL